MIALFQIFRLFSLHHILKNKLRTLFVLVLITIGSASMFIAIDAIFKRDSTRDYGISILHGSASISIQSTEDSPVTEEILQSIRSADAVEIASPIILDAGLLLSESHIFPVIGIDPQTESQIRSYDLQEGTFLTEEGQILITDVFAESYHVGDILRFVGKGGIKSYTIVGILSQTGIAAFNGGDMFFLHYVDVQDIARDNSFDFVSVVSSGNVDSTLSQLESTLPQGIQISNLNSQPEKTLIDVVIDVLGIISNGLPAVFGALMITSSLASSVAFRRKEIAILRSLGTTQSGVQNILVIEAAILGFIGSLFGLALAIALNQGFLTGEAEIESFVVSGINSNTPLWVYGFIFITGILMSIAAMWIPARRTSSIDPTEAMRQAPIPSKQSSISKIQLGAGVLIILSAIILRFAFDNTALVPLAVLSGIVLVILGISLLFAPILAWLLQHITGLMQPIFGFSGLLASENLHTRYHRAISTGLLSMLVIWFVGLVSAFDVSTAYLATDFIDSEYNWDLIVAGAGEDARDSISSLPETALEEILARDDIETAVIERQAPYVYQNTDFTIRAVDLTTFLSAGGHFAWEMGDEALAYERLQNHEQPAILVGGFEALMLGLRQVGQTVRLSTPLGDMGFEVVGTINSPTGNTMVIDHDLYLSIWGDTQIDRVSINLLDDADKEAVRRNLSQSYRADGIIVTDRDELRALFAGAGGGAAFIAVSALLLPFMMLGIANMFFISVLDRRREFGILRAIGTRKWQIIASVILEALILVGFACLLAIPAVYLSIETMLFERIVGTHVQPDPLLILRTVIMILVAVTLAVYLPARRAAKLDILEALRYE